MSTRYRVYKNDGAGGPVDYGTVVATVTSGTSCVASALATPSDTTFAVRAYDSVSGLEEDNVDCRVRIVIDAAGVDVTNRPNAPVGLTARATAGGGAVVEWGYATAGQRGAPTGFKVWATAGASVNYAVSPAATVSYAAGRPSHTATLTGLVDGTSYSIGVRATNAKGDETNTNKTTVVGDSTGPDAVEGLTATVGYGG